MELYQKHPFKGEVWLDKERGQTARDRYIEDWEIAEALALRPMRERGSVRMIRGYIRLKRATGRRD